MGIFGNGHVRAPASGATDACGLVLGVCWVGWDLPDVCCGERAGPRSSEDVLGTPGNVTPDTKGVKLPARLRPRACTKTVKPGAGKSIGA